MHLLQDFGGPRQSLNFLYSSRLPLRDRFLHQTGQIHHLLVIVLGNEIGELLQKSSIILRELLAAKHPLEEIAIHGFISRVFPE